MTDSGKMIFLGCREGSHTPSRIQMAITELGRFYSESTIGLPSSLFASALFASAPLKGRSQQIIVGILDDLWVKQAENP